MSMRKFSRRYERMLQREFSYFDDFEEMYDNDEIDKEARSDGRSILGFFNYIMGYTEWSRGIDELLEQQAWYRHTDGLDATEYECAIDSWRMISVHRLVLEYKEQLRLYLL